jgi:hypothetical protein
MTRHKGFSLFWMLFASALFTACEQPFSPKMEYTPQLVVYGFMETSLDRQVVRVYSTYNPPGTDPMAQQEDTTVKGAHVTISDGTKTSVLGDTLIPRNETDRYSSEIYAYVCKDLQIRPGGVYTLQVSAPSFGSVSAIASPPKGGYVELATGYVSAIYPSRDSENISVSAHVAFEAKGFLVQFFVEYEVVSGSQGQTVSSEIPVDWVYQDSTSFTPIYPQLGRIQSQGSATALYRYQIYLAALRQINREHQNETLNPKRAKFYLYQVEPALYDYYSVVNGFQDPFSIRMDKPDRTNIQGGYGVFAGMTVDSLIYQLPPDFFNAIK